MHWHMSCFGDTVEIACQLMRRTPRDRLAGLKGNGLKF